MKTKKRRMEYISFYNHTGLEKHFSKMAKKGWLIESISNYYWTYRRIEPKDLHFCVTYYPRASDFDPEPSPEQQTFHDFCAHTGWQLCCTWHQMQVFYNEKEDPIPLETDPVLEVETLHKACKKNFLPSYFLLLALGLIMGGSVIARVFADPIGLLSNASQLFTGFCFFCVAVISIAELGAYFTWYIKAKKAAQDGIFVDTPSTAKLQLSIVILTLIALIVWLINLVFSGDPIYTWVALLMFGYVIALTAIVNGIKHGLKKAKASRGVNKFLTIFACFALSFVMMGGVVWLTMSITNADLLERNPEIYEKAPLTLSDLIEIDKDKYMSENRLNQTVLLSERVVHQRKPFDTEGTSTAPDLRYRIITVKVPFLYEWCKEQMYYDQDETNSNEWPVGNRMVYKEQDPIPWGADEVYRLYSEEGWWAYTYLLCYEERIIEIRFDWEPTTEQMGTVAQKLNP